MSVGRLGRNNSELPGFRVEEFETFSQSRATMAHVAG
ncbi:MAG: hypothetical protein ACI841_003598, partial [Planctomycetota bacterium]